LATDRMPNNEMDEPGDGRQRLDPWDRVEKTLPLLALAMEGQDLDIRLFVLLMLVLVIQAMASEPRQEK